MSATRTSSSSCANNVVVKSGAPNWPKMVSYKAATPELISTVASSTVAATAVSASLRRPSPNPKGTGTGTGMGRSGHISAATPSNKDKGSSSNGSNNSNSNRKPLLTGGDNSNNIVKGGVVKPNLDVCSKVLSVAVDYRSGENQNNSNSQAPYLNNNTTYLSPRNRRPLKSEGEDVCASAATSTAAVASVQAPMMMPSNNNKLLPFTHRSTNNVTVGIGASCGDAQTQLVRQCHKCQVLFAHSHICG
jgi:hypothetical protein